jgi:UDP-N-acetylmuramoyl-L-alanyl-D-glutamate--2,6-diaminopimelate ligase
MNLLFDDTTVLEVTGDPAAAEVRGIAYDSRQVRPGDLFCCLPGAIVDGHRFAPDAVRAGAVGLLCEHVLRGPMVDDVPQACVPPGAARAAMAQVAAAFYGFPARDLLTVGVTGTNGKTTVTHLLAAVLERSGHPTTVVGTLSGERTTPESVDLQRLLSEVRDAQRADGRSRAVSLEVSSHALAQARVDGIHFEVVAFTNLSHDHLDFHRTMEEYARTKASLFDPGRALRGVVCTDDAWGRRILAGARIPTVAVSRHDATDVVHRPGGMDFTWRGERVCLPLVGGFNVVNALVAAECALALGLDAAGVAAGLASASPVPGRMEVVAGGDDATGFTVVVDYAHTPDALTVVLVEARHLVTGTGRVLAVFGCGGDRDRAKRPEMGAAAAAGADRCYLTSDNPRHEDPLAIIDAVLAGVPAGAGVVVEPDRRRAIELALGDARPGDVVVVAGKGHETAQEVGDRRLPFDDRSVVRSLLGAPSGPAGAAAGG